MLKSVVHALVKKDPHIPYRNSKLTRLLEVSLMRAMIRCTNPHQDSLGGNSKAAMFACFGPTADHAEQSMSTIRFATDVKLVGSNCLCAV